jgi:hypothetical protein
MILPLGIVDEARLPIQYRQQAKFSQQRSPGAR